MRNNGVTVDILWKLDDDMMNECNCNPIETLAYKEAKNAYLNAHQGNLNYKYIYLGDLYHQ